MRNDDLLLLVGKLNYAWTNTESLLIYLISFLMKTSKEAAIVAFLTLNTTRARLDFVERLAKMVSTDSVVRTTLLTVTARMKTALKMRNKYNHCIYSFDSSGLVESTQMLRIADYGAELKYGKIESIDADEIDRIRNTIEEIALINKAMLAFLDSHSIVR